MFKAMNKCCFLACSGISRSRKSLGMPASSVQTKYKDKDEGKKKTECETQGVYQIRKIRRKYAGLTIHMNHFKCRRKNLFPLTCVQDKTCLHFPSHIN